MRKLGVHFSVFFALHFHINSNTDGLYVGVVMDTPNTDAANPVTGMMSLSCNGCDNDINNSNNNDSNMTGDRIADRDKTSNKIENRRRRSSNET